MIIWGAVILNKYTIITNKFIGKRKPFPKFYIVMNTKPLNQGYSEGIIWGWEISPENFTSGPKPCRNSFANINTFIIPSGTLSFLNAIGKALLVCAACCPIMLCLSTDYKLIGNVIGLFYSMLWWDHWDTYGLNPVWDECRLVRSHRAVVNAVAADTELKWDAVWNVL